MTIVTDTDGTRYRLTAELADESTPHGTPTAPLCTYNRGGYCDIHDSLGSHRYIQLSQGIFWENVRRFHPTRTYPIAEPLPSVPDWPLPGQPPQYLRQLRAEDRHMSGDIWLILLDADGDGEVDEVWSSSVAHERAMWELLAPQFFRTHLRITVPESGPIDGAYLVARADPSGDAP